MPGYYIWRRERDERYATPCVSFSMQASARDTCDRTLEPNPLFIKKKNAQTYYLATIVVGPFDELRVIRPPPGLP